MTEEGGADETEPDATYHSRAISRRALLAAGATAAASGMAGCADCYGPQQCKAAVSEQLSSALRGDSEGGPSREDDQTRTELEVVEGYELELGAATLDSLQFSLKNDLSADQQPEEAVEGRLRVYGRTPLGEDEVVLGETRASLRGSPQDHEVSLEFDEDLMNTPRELEVRFLSHLTATGIVLGRSEVVYLPFDNVAKDERTLRALGSKYMPGDDWSSPGTGSQKVELWYDEFDETSFNVPALDKSQYDYRTAAGADWFDLYDLRLTAVIRTPVLTEEFYTNEDGETEGPYFDWTVIHLEQSALEYLEAVIWNSPATMKLLNTNDEWSAGERRNSDEKIVEDKKDFASSLLVEPSDFSDYDVPRVAQDANPLSDYVLEGTVHEDVGAQPTPPDDLRRGNPLKFAIGRSISRRWATKFANAYEEKPYVNSTATLEYHQLTALKAFVGDFVYDLRLGDYTYSPEETVVNMYWNAVNPQNLRRADSGTATIFFLGIAYWMTGNHPVLPVVSVPDGGRHAFAGLEGLTLPDLSHIGDHPVSGDTQVVTGPSEASEIEYTYRDIECVGGFPTIGFGFEILDDPSRELVTWSNLEEFTLTTNIPVNDDWEPDVDGELRAPFDGKYSFGMNPFETGSIYHFEDERTQ